jgi:glycosyltransferase involved in cell wall biosynthesis
MTDSKLLSNVTLVGVIGTMDKVGGAEKAFRAITDGFRDHLGANLIRVAHIKAEHEADEQADHVLRPNGEPAGLGMILGLRKVLLEAPRPAVLFPFQIGSNIVAMAANLLLPPSKRLPSILNDRASIDFMTQAGFEQGMSQLVRCQVVARSARFMYPRADYVVCNAERNARAVETFMGRSEPPVRTIYNPLRAEEYQAQFPERDRSGLQGDHPLIMAHGRLHPQKGWDTLMRAFAKARQSVPDARLRIIGEGPERAYLEGVAQEVGIADCCELPGFSRDYIEAIAECDVYVLPSRFEGLPNSLLEAISIGLPAIACNCPTGPDEILGTDEEHGILVPVDDVDAMAKQLVRLLGDGALRNRLASSARRRAMDFTIDHNVAGYAEIFQDLISRGRLPGA